VSQESACSLYRSIVKDYKKNLTGESLELMKANEKYFFLWVQYEGSLGITESDNASLIEVNKLISSLTEFTLSRQAGIFCERTEKWACEVTIDHFIKNIPNWEGVVLEEKREEFENWLCETVFKEVFLIVVGVLKHCLYILLVVKLLLQVKGLLSSFMTTGNNE
jgi:hypothetical protein